MLNCEWENRCVNNSKCYRCKDNMLLKLKEDKLKSKMYTNKSYNTKKATSDESWKDLEERVAGKLNNIPTIIEARRSRRSGALWFEPGDVVDSILHPECKERKGKELKTGTKSMTIQKDWLEKAKEECENSERTMCLPFRFKEDESIYCIIDFDDLAKLVTDIKAFMLDNEIKNSEIESLKKYIKKKEVMRNE